MKKFIVALMVLATFASCGKNNSIATNGLVANGVSTVSSAPLDSSGRVSLANYITDINNNAFGAARSVSETYRYLNYDPSSSSNGCPTNSYLGGMFNFGSCFGSSTTSMNYGSYDTVNVVQSSENLTSKKNELIALINKSTSYGNSADRKQLGFYTSNGDYFLIDFRVPMSANPVFKYTVATKIKRSFDYSFSGYSAY